MQQPIPIPTPPAEEGSSYSRPSLGQAAADAIPLLVDDTYHVFHLTTPPFTRHHPPRLRSTWSRLRSTDLVHWARDPEPVLRPSDDPSAPDADGIWTGAAVIGPDGNMNIFYTGYNLQQGGKQVILRTVANDRHGTAFSGPTSQISIKGDNDALAVFEDIDFRDAFVFFNNQSSEFWMLVATRLRKGPNWTRGCIALLTSPDLDEWTVAPEPLYSPNDMFCPECPELFQLPNGKWYLVYSRFAAPNPGTVYRMADTPRGPFRIPRDGSHGRLDGRRWYAAKSCPKAGEPEKRIFFGWIGDRVDDEGKWLWGGDLGVPREVWADENGYLQVDSGVEVRRLFLETSTSLSPNEIPEILVMSATGSTQTIFPELGLAATQNDLLIEFNIHACDSHGFGILLHADDDLRGHRLHFAPCMGQVYSITLFIDLPSLDDFWADQYNLHVPRPVDGPEMVRHENVKINSAIRVFLRGQLVEVLCGGRSISFRLPEPKVRGVYNETITSAASQSLHRLGWYVEDGTIELRRVLVRQGGQVGKVR